MSHEAVQYVKHNNMGSTYNPGWRNHPNFSWGGNAPYAGYSKQGPPPGFSQNTPNKQAPGEEVSELRDMVKTLATSLTSQQATLRALHP